MYLLNSLPIVPFIFYFIFHEMMMGSRSLEEKNPGHEGFPRTCELAVLRPACFGEAAAGEDAEKEAACVCARWGKRGWLELIG